MTPEQYGKLCRLFDQAQQISFGKARIAFLDRACAGDPALRAELEQLLAHDDKARSEGYLMPPVLPADAPPKDAMELAPTISFQGAEARRGDPPVFVMEGYAAERKLGEGGMGEVLLVRHCDDNRSYAVKRAKFRDAIHRRNFLAELQTWMDLPEHPHLAAYRFFRTVAEDVLIFSDFIDGGSLGDWIKDGRLYRGGKEAALRRILDISIQTAWGLHALHVLGLVHQDVKPGNMLVTQDGIVKMSDFGLARARTVGSQAARPNGADPTVLVSYGGMTPAYCSPEQEAGRQLTRRTDVWSWGLSVLQMFTRKVSWRRGSDAPRLLRVLTAITTEHPLLPRMPPKLATILGHCFRQNPADRWPNLALAAADLVRLYEEIVSARYPREMPPEPRRIDAASQVGATRTGTRWDQPLACLRKALLAEGRSPDEADTFDLSRRGSYRAQGIADMALFEEARQIYERLVAAGRSDVVYELATLCSEEALLHLHLRDEPQALRLFDRAIQLYERLLPDGRVQVRSDLAVVLSNKAYLLMRQNQSPAALPLLDRAIDIVERLIAEGALSNEAAGLERQLAKGYMNKACALEDLRRFAQAVEFYDRSILIRRRLAGTGIAEMRSDLAISEMNKANLLRQMGVAQEANHLYADAIEILRGLVADGQDEWELTLAVAYFNNGNVLVEMGDLQEGRQCFDLAIAIHERLVAQGRHADQCELAKVYMNKAGALRRSGALAEAIGLYDRAAEVCRRLIREGQEEVQRELARVLKNSAVVLIELGNPMGGAAASEEAIGIYKRLVTQGHNEVEPELAAAIANQGVVLMQLGDLPRAVGSLDCAVEIYQRLVAGGRDDLSDQFRLASSNRSMARERLGGS